MATPRILVIPSISQVSGGTDKTDGFTDAIIGDRINWQPPYELEA
jgi:hypothetical protein